jgi:hypothetical protein
MKASIGTLVFLPLALCGPSGSFGQVPGATEADAFPSSVTVDDSSHIFYCYGHRLHGPVTFSVIDGRLAANGFGPPTEAPDTAKLEDIARRAYARVPMVERLRGQGMSFWEAGEVFERHLEETLDGAMKAYAAALPRGKLEAENAAKRSLDPEIIDPSESISVTDGGISVYVIGCGRLIRALGSRPGPFEHSSSVDQRRASQMAGRIASALLSDQPTVVILCRSGMAVYSGADAQDTLREIDVTWRRRTAGESVEEAASHGYLPRQALIEILTVGERKAD